MSLNDFYKLTPTEQLWAVPQSYDAVFDWSYDDSRDELIKLYEKGKSQQWNATHRIDWDQELGDDNPNGVPDEFFPIFGSDIWEKMSDAEKAVTRRNYQAWTVSQFLHGEQGALFCASKIVQQVPDMEAKFYAATQVIDEARHVEAYQKLLKKYEAAYPITGPLKTLLDQVMQDSRWDMTYLGMQVVIEGLALAAFAMTRDLATNQLASQVNAYVMQDEARHVAFGRLTLRDYYPQLTEAERDEREEFLVEACYHMRDRFMAKEVWEALGLPVDECMAHIEQSEGMKLFRSNLFSRIVPVVKDIGLWGDRVTKAYADMGILGFAQTDIDALQENDDVIAKQFDERRRYVESVAGEAHATAAE